MYNTDDNYDTINEQLIAQHQLPNNKVRSCEMARVFSIIAGFDDNISVKRMHFGRN
jgi:hypothetical protein